MKKLILRWLQRDIEAIARQIAVAEIAKLVDSQKQGGPAFKRLS